MSSWLRMLPGQVTQRLEGSFQCYIEETRQRTYYEKGSGLSLSMTPSWLPGMFEEGTLFQHGERDLDPQETALKLVPHTH